MKVTELRIGNLVTQKCSFLTERVTLELLCRKDVILEPITITEEWLLKFGFEQSDNDLFELLFVNNQDIRCDLWTRGKDGLTIILSTSQGEEPKQTDLTLEHIKSVHQLQNLYFALTGKELVL